MCATHIIRDFVHKVRSGALDLAAIGISSYGLQVWRVRYITSVEKTDVSILTLSFESKMPPNHTFHQAMLTTRLPPVGEPVVFGGFRAARDEFLPVQPGTIEIEGAMRLGSGVVTQVFPRGRDRLLVSWPALEVDAPLFGGMSGGPVFDSRGGLIGLGSRSMEMGVGVEPSPMIVALLWPALGQAFPLDADPSLTGSLMDLHEALTIIERPEAVSVESTADGLVTSYTPWT
jgi:trypsin-like peptidase